MLAYNERCLLFQHSLVFKGRANCNPLLLSLLTRALAFQAASRVNNIAADYTHIIGMKSVMKGGIYVYSQLNANRKSINLAFMLSPFNEVL